MEVCRWRKKEWPVRTGPTYGLETRSRLFHRSKERPSTEKGGQNPLQTGPPDRTKRILINKKGLCSQARIKKGPLHFGAALRFLRGPIAKDRVPLPDICPGERWTVDRRPRRFSARAVSRAPPGPQAFITGYWSDSFLPGCRRPQGCKTAAVPASGRSSGPGST